MKILTTFLAAAVVAAFPMSAMADFITPVSAGSSSDFNGSQSATETINASGFPGGLTSAADDSDTGGPDNLHWLSGNNSTVSAEWIEFDLGMEYDLTAAYFWNYSFPGNDRFERGVSQFDLVGGGADGVLDTNLLTDQALAAGGEGTTQSSETFAISATGIQFIRLEVDSSHGVDLGGESRFVGLSEARFEGTASTIPEPGSLALLGLASMGLFVRRRK